MKDAAKARGFTADTHAAVDEMLPPTGNHSQCFYLRQLVLKLHKSILSGFMLCAMAVSDGSDRRSLGMTSSKRSNCLFENNNGSSSVVSIAAIASILLELEHIYH